MLEVLGAGPGRTGTESLQEALHILDKGPCYHMSEVFKGGRPRIDLWLECERNVTKGTEFDFERIYAEDGKTAFKSAVDYPSVTFFPEIFIQYPNVKVVLSVRDSAEVWADSVMGTIGDPKLISRLWMVSRVLFFLRPMYCMCDRTVWGHPRAFNNQYKDREYMIQYYNRWLEEVRQAVPGNQLLEFNVKQGWEPLCAFLGTAVPEQPFPRKNDREQLNKRWNSFFTTKAVQVATVLAVVGLGVWVGMKKLK